MKRKEIEKKADSAGDTVFALDIGTRSVVGIVGTNSDDMFSVFDYEQRMHKKRAMRDGQIEDINLVAKTAAEIKEALEERNDMKFTRVSIAAAGRSLKTVRTTYEQALNEDENITEELLNSIEYNAISAALDSFSADNDMRSAFSCVGYDVVSYRLDGYLLSNPLSHRGERIVIEIIAAFLPFSVIRSLYSVTSLCGLTVESLTLEPIAAINAVVPQDIRLLNIAIADIGAGTSDIGISKNGSIVAYDMVTIAGDEVTETLMRQYIVDFNTGESIKFKLSEDGGMVTFQDILGISHTYSKEDVLSAINPVVEDLCDSIAGSILRINDGPPTALFLVGGGSQIPGLCVKMAGKLDMPAERVTLGGKHPYSGIVLHTDKLLTPEYVTPIGIAATSRLTHIHDLFSVTVNGEKVTLPGSENIKVLDALLLSGIKASNLIGRAAGPLVYYVNDEKKTLRAEPPVPGEIFVNKEPATIDTPVRQGDEITVVFAQHGKAPRITAADILKNFGEAGGYKAMCGGKRIRKNYQVKNGDIITVSPGAGDEDVSDTFEYIELKEPPAASAPKHEKPVRMSRVSVNGEWLNIPVSEGESPLFLDMLNYVDIDTKKARGDLILSINGAAASYTDPIRDGDKVEIKWEE